MASIAEQLEKIASLFEKGLLTRSQFDEERDRILARSRAESGGTPHGQGPKRIGLGTLGVGGMGVVYRARCTLDARRAEQGGDVALKVLNASLGPLRLSATRAEARPWVAGAGPAAWSRPLVHSTLRTFKVDPAPARALCRASARATPPRRPRRLQVPPSGQTSPHAPRAGHLRSTE